MRRLALRPCPLPLLISAILSPLVNATHEVEGQLWLRLCLVMNSGTADIDLHSDPLLESANKLL